MKKKLELIGTSICLLGGLVGLVLCSYSWFVVNRKAHANGGDISMVADDMSIDYTVYKWNLQEGQAYTTDEDGNRLTLSSLSLMQYDAVFKEKNKYTPIIVRLSVTGTTMKDSGLVSVNIARDTSNANASITSELAAYTSNITTFACGLGLSYSGETPTELYENALATFTTGSSIPTFRSFTTSTGTTYVKSSTIGFDVHYSLTDWENNYLYVYMYIGYQETLADAFVDANKDEIRNQITLGFDLTIANDIRTIAVSHS